MIHHDLTRFSIESYFPENTEVTTDNYNKYDWFIYKDGKYLTSIGRGEVCKHQVEVLVNSCSEKQIIDTITTIVGNMQYHLDKIKSIL